ncbi:hypothetical protein TL16_g07256 [Triparma laevis f. inornata]|uniref:MYND-type domain-containing protein n=1 Tax=Triparma laevis f. inornata TaxID=1714386 RepID=A0A9W7EGD6_9STRA|nr:hypothetical protein TL16_g07256 [Triparma laevis f. inornata]
MPTSQPPSKPAAEAKPAPHCTFPGCKVPPTKTCFRCKETQYCYKEHQADHWRWHKKICVAPDEKLPAFVPPAPPLVGSVNEEEDDEDTCIICLNNVVNAKLRPCGHSAT